MSTKANVTYCVDDATGASAHIFEECLAPKESVVFLEFSSVSEVSIDVTVCRRASKTTQRCALNFTQAL